MKKLLILLSLGILLSLASVSAVSISSCTNLTTANTIYVLSKNINSFSSCFNVTTVGYNNITLDCNGYKVARLTSGTGSGVSCSASTTAGCGYNVWNCTFINFSTSLNSYNPNIASANPTSASKVIIINSNLSGSVSFAATDGNPSSGTFNGATGGNVTCTNSNLSTVSIYGGKAYGTPTVGGVSGIFTGTNCSYNIINAYGGAGATAGFPASSKNCNGGMGGLVNLTSSSGGNINAYGGAVAAGACNGTSGEGGNVIAIANSVINGNINSYTLITGAGKTLDNGGNLTVINSTFNGAVALDGTIKGTFVLANSSFNDASFNHGKFLFIMSDTYGTINFMNNVLNGTLSISRNVIINNNSIYINSSQVGLNVPANLTFYNAPSTFTEPAIIQNDNSFCTETTNPKCSNFTSLNAGVVSINMSAWSGIPSSGNYSINEISSIFVFPTAVIPCNSNYTFWNNYNVNNIGFIGNGRIGILGNFTHSVNPSYYIQKGCKVFIQQGSGFM